MTETQDYLKQNCIFNAYYLIIYFTTKQFTKPAVHLNLSDCNIHQNLRTKVLNLTFVDFSSMKTNGRIVRICMDLPNGRKTLEDRQGSYTRLVNNINNIL
jgi:hypothetical protein